MIQLSDFKKHVITLAGGTAIAQLINISILPWLTRLYSLEEFGTYALYVSFVAIIGAISTARYEMAIIADESDKAAWAATNLVITLSFLSAILTLCVGYILPLIGDFIFFDNQEVVVLLISGSVLLNGIYTGFYYWLNRNSLYTAMSLSRIYGAITFLIISVTLGYLGNTKYGLIIATVSNVFVNTFFLSIKAFQINKHKISISQIIECSLRHSKYPKYLIPSGLLERMSKQMQVILLSGFYGVSVAGALNLYQKVVSVPSSIIGNAIKDVFKDRASREYEKQKQCHHLFKKTVYVQIVIGIIPFFLLLLFAPEMFTFVFGTKWLIAGEFAQIMSFMFFFGFIVSPVSSVALIAQKQNYVLYYQLFLFVGAAVGLYAGYIIGDVKTAISFYVTVYCIKYMFEFFIAYNISKGNMR